MVILTYKFINNNNNNNNNNIIIIIIIIIIIKKILIQLDLFITFPRPGLIL